MLLFENLIIVEFDMFNLTAASEEPSFRNFLTSFLGSSWTSKVVDMPSLVTLNENKSLNLELDRFIRECTQFQRIG
ncbi:MAG: hypothetical protein QXT84_05890 [Candidatus Bathyarchaeia archaeon]